MPRQFQQTLAALKEPLTLYQPNAGADSVSPLDVGNESVEGTWVEHSGFYCRYLAPRATSVFSEDRVLQELTAAVVLNWEPLLDDVGDSWECQVLGKRYRVQGVPVPWLDTQRFVKIDIALTGVE